MALPVAAAVCSRVDCCGGTVEMVHSRCVRRVLAVTGVLLATLAIAVPVSAGPGSGSVTVQATNNAAITLSVSDGTADFGSNLDPLGTDSNSSDTGQVKDFQDANGSYYLWRSAGGNGLTVTVKSNTSWTGSVAASPNTGSARSMSIQSGSSGTVTARRGVTLTRLSRRLSPFLPLRSSTRGPRASTRTPSSTRFE